MKTKSPMPIRVVVDDERSSADCDAEPDQRALAFPEHSEQEGGDEHADEVAARIRDEAPFQIDPATATTKGLAAPNGNPLVRRGSTKSAANAAISTVFPCSL
jgi:hypothetical protein